MKIFSASCSLGAAQASLQKTGEYLKVRKQFGKTLDQFQVRKIAKDQTFFGWIYSILAHSIPICWTLHEIDRQSFDGEKSSDGSGSKC